MLKIYLRTKNNKTLLARFFPEMVDQYLIAQALPSFAIALSVILLALMLERLLVLLDLLATDNSPLSTFLGLLADLLPHYLGLAIPAAFCVAVFSSIRRMSLNNEIDAMLSSGISLFRCTRPFIISGCIISLLSIILYGYLQPYARYDFRAAFYYASHAGWSPHIQSRMIIQPDETLTMIVDSADQYGTRLSGVFIREKTKNKQKQLLEHIIVAKRGFFHMSNDGSKVQLDLYNGQIITIHAQGKNSVTNFNITSRILKRNNKNIVFRSRGDDERELTLSELYGQLHKHTLTIPLLDMKAEFHFRLTRALSIIFIPILATGLAVLGKRKQRSFGLVIAAIILITYDHIQQFGSNLIEHSQFSPFIALWLPFIFFAIICYSCLLQKSGLYRLCLPSFSLLKQTKKKIPGSS